jgi:hypothetical protein
MNSDEQFKKKISKSIVIEALKKNVRLIYKEKLEKYLLRPVVNWVYMFKIRVLNVIDHFIV